MGGMPCDSILKSNRPLSPPDRFLPLPHSSSSYTSPQASQCPVTSTAAHRFIQPQCHFRSVAPRPREGATAPGNAKAQRSYPSLPASVKKADRYSSISHR